MIIERKFSKFVVFNQDNILNALQKISENKSGIIFTVSESGILQGVVTDGDIRRWLTDNKSLDLTQAISNVANARCEYASISDNANKINSMLNERILAVPLVDHQKRLVAVALPKEVSCDIAHISINEKSPVFVIAEVGNNHNGSLINAKKLIDKAVESGADCAKFQMRDMSTLYRNMGETDADLGTQYTIDLLNRFQLSDDQLFAAFDYCRENNIIPLCTPWDENSYKKLKNYGLAAYKISSADFTNFELIRTIAQSGKPLICSTGMATENEIRQGIAFLKSLNVPYILLHCNSTYPAPFKDINLVYMNHIKELGNCLVGYSGHERGIAIAISAVALGAKIIEKHLTLDKTWEGNDHKVSLLPAEFQQMVEGIRQLELALDIESDERQLSQGEMMNREVLAKSLIAAMDISHGTIITRDMIEVKSPGQGLQPNRIDDLIGRVLLRDMSKSDFFFQSDLGEEQTKARDYHFDRKWGVPVRYHDLQKMKDMSNMDLLEIHLSYKDMELDFKTFFPQPLHYDLVVHAPELFSGDHTLDLCSTNPEYRKRSIKELRSVIDLTRQLKPFFLTAKKPMIVINVGGFSNIGHIDHKKRELLYRLLEDSLYHLDTEGVELIPQTMPPFPWHFGGQQYHNLFMDAQDIKQFCEKHAMRICMDVSHTQLACNQYHWSLTEFIKQTGQFIAHLHLADAKDVDGEGLQIGEGDIDWVSLFAVLRKHSPDATFIPEIWQGHKNNGEKAWSAMAALEKYNQLSLE